MKKLYRDVNNLALSSTLQVIKGWYISSRQNEPRGESIAWYASFWDFCAAYLGKRFGNKWCLSPEQSLLLHIGNWTVPLQLLVRTSKGGNKLISLPHDTSLLDARYAVPAQREIEIINNIRVFSLPAALIACSSRFYIQNPIDVRTALLSIKDSSEILSILLAGGHSTVAGRLAGAFRNINRDNIADEIIKTMSSAGYDIREQNPFNKIPLIHFAKQEKSPCVNRIKILWENMRKVVIENFQESPKKTINIESYLKNVEEIYVTDAYHSLSIEGYRVSPELIERVRSGKWDPDNSENDKDHIVALAARGYWQTFKLVEKSIVKVLKGKSPGKIFAEDHRDWYREMFAPCVTAGIIKPSELAGYRRHSVYIRRSRHVPPNAC